MIEGDVGEALRALDALLLHVCDVEERRAEAMRGAERGWDSLRAAIRPEATDLAYASSVDDRPLCPPHGPAALVRARRSLGLEELEVDVLVVLLAAHLEPRYSRVYTALQDDTAHGFVVERLLHQVLARSPSRGRRLAATLAEGGRLLETGLVAPSPGAHPPQLRPVDLAPDARDAILDLPHPRSLAGLALGWSPARGPAPRDLAAVVYGPGERTEKARAVAGEATTVTVTLDGAPDPATVRAIWRLAALRGAVPILDASDLGPAEANAVAALAARLVRLHGGCAIVASRTPAPVPVPHHLAPALRYAERRALWLDETAAAGAPIDEATAGRLATNLRIGREEVRDVLATAPTPDFAGLSAAAQRLARVTVRHGHRVPTTRTFEDLVVCDTTRATLERLIHFAEQRDRLAEERDLEARFRLMRGPIVLFSGRSGTGKTLAAEVVAGALGRPLFVVDLSRLVSKFIGETEKHIDESLASGERAGAVLFFDEADSLFAARTEVATSNDRFANLEVGYLLQRIEHHDGLVILATNLQHTIDEAFLRRFHTRVEFPFPETEQRRRIWELMLPGGVPRAGDLAVAEIAQQHRLAGGDIRNAALKAIFLAEREGLPLSRTHLERAVALELYELGRLSRRNGDGPDAGTRLRRFAQALEETLEADLRHRFLKEVHVVHGSPTKETLAGRRPAVSVAMYRVAAGAEPGVLRLGVVMSAWSARPEEEHELLGVLLQVMSEAPLGRATGSRVRVQQSYDFDLLHRFWSSHGHPVRPSLVLDVDLG